MMDFLSALRSGRPFRRKKFSGEWNQPPSCAVAFQIQDMLADDWETMPKSKFKLYRDNNKGLVLTVDEGSPISNSYYAVKCQNCAAEVEVEE